MKEHILQEILKKLQSIEEKQEEILNKANQLDNFKSNTKENFQIIYDAIKSKKNI